MNGVIPIHDNIFHYTVFNVLRRLQNDGITVTNEVLWAEFDRIYKAPKNLTWSAVDPSAEAEELIAFIKHFIETAPFTKGTIAGYRNLCNNLEEYQKLQNTVLTFQNIDMQLLQRFHWLSNYAPKEIIWAYKIPVSTADRIDVLGAMIEKFDVRKIRNGQRLYGIIAHTTSHSQRPKGVHEHFDWLYSLL